MKEKEIWKAIPGFEGYEASNLGRIRSLKSGKIKVLKPGMKRNGYYRLNLCKDGKRKEFTIHRLGFSTFNGPIPPGMTVDHINGIKTDNRLENLQLLSRGDNARKANKGKPTWNKGKKCKPLTEEHKAKISAAHKGKKHSEEHKAKISAAHKARREKRLGIKR